MAFFHHNGFERAALALQDERSAALQKLAAELQTAVDTAERQRIRDEQQQAEALYEDKLRKLASCLF